MTIYNASHLLWQQIQTDNGAPESTWGQARRKIFFFLVMDLVMGGVVSPVDLGSFQIWTS